MQRRILGPVERFPSRDWVAGAILIIVGLFLLAGRFLPGLDRLIPLFAGLALLGVFFGLPGDRLYVTVKLPASNSLALAQPFAEPSGYGLGRAGWVTSAFDPGDAVPVDLLREWIDESYRAVAPRTLVARLGTQPG